MSLSRVCLLYVCLYCCAFFYDSVYLAEPFFQDGILAQAANDAAQIHGVPYFSAIGNNGRNSWESLSDFVPSGEKDWNQCDFHDFGYGHTAVPHTRQQIVLGPEFLEADTLGRTHYLVFQWDDPFYSVSGGTGAVSDLDVWIFQRDGKTILGADIVTNTGADPVAVVTLLPNHSPTREDGSTVFQLAFSLCHGPPPTRLKWVLFGPLTEIQEPITTTPTTAPMTTTTTTTTTHETAYASAAYGQGNAPYVAGVGAAFFQDTPAFGTTPPQLQPFSSAGGTPIVWNRQGQRLIEPEVRHQPRFVATDGCSNTFFGTWDNYQPNGWGFYFFGMFLLVLHV